MPPISFTLPSWRGSRRGLTWVAGVVVIAICGLAPVAAQTREDVDRARAEQEQVREEALEVAASIDSLGDESDDLVAKLS